MPYASKILSRWKDQNNDGGVSEFFMPSTVTDPTDPTVTAIINAMKAISDAANTAIYGELYDGTTIGAATAGDYDDAEDKLRMIFQDAAGGQHTYDFPSPLETIFLPDKETPDPANALFLALKGAIQDNCTSTNGLALTYLKGYRTRSRRIKHPGRP